MTTINTAANPYFDDYAPEKGFHKILFKPGVAVQSRELTQMQTILQEQIKRFGDHVFKNGTVVIPGSSSVDRTAIYIRCQDTYLGTEIDLSKFVGQQVANQYGVRAMVTHTAAAAGTDPKTIFIKYIRGSDDGNRVRFDQDDVISVINTSTNLPYASNQYKLSIEDLPSFTGFASIANITAGVFYINGKFVYVEKQSTIISKYSDQPHCRVLLRLDESIVTAEDDATLLDPAFGSYNYAAPGADRYKVALTLVAQPYTFAPSDDYIELMRYNNGNLEEHLRSSKYSELEKNIARRTSDESGDYTVSGLKISATDHLKGTNTPSGQWSYLQGGDTDKISVKVSSGKAYVKGFEIDKISDTYLSIDKARTASHVRSVNDLATTAEFGQYVLITDLGGLPNITAYETVSFYTTSATSGGTLLGTAKASGLRLHSGDPETATAVYALYIFDRSVASSELGVGGVRWASGGAAIVQEYTVTGATGAFDVAESVSVDTLRYGVVHSWNTYTSKLVLKKSTTGVGLTNALPAINDIVVGGTSTSSAYVRNIVSMVVKNPSSILQLPVSNIKSIYFVGSEINYEVSRRLQVTTTNNSTTATISSGVLAPKTSDNTVARTASVNIPLSLVTFSGGNTITIDTTGIANGTTLYLIVPVTIINPTKKSKTVTSATENLVEPGQSVTLTKADVIQINSVTATLIASPFTATDITSQCRITDSGQRDSYYAPTKIDLGASYAGYNVSVNYDFYAHSSGDFFCVDSYPTVDEIGTYTTSDGQTLDLVQALDFRPVIGGSSPVAVEYPRDMSRIFVDLQYYVGRKDSVFLESNGVIRVVSGVPSETPVLPSSVLAGAMQIATLDIPPYTKYGKDVKVKNIQNKRYTMRDIGAIEERVARIEYYSTLSETEKGVIDMEIINPATGLDRFKSGFLIDGFDINTTGDMLREGFAASYDNSMLFPRQEATTGVMEYSSGDSSNIAIRGGVITLPFNERQIIAQPYASRVTNLNPFLNISWVGDLTLTPSVDMWVDTLPGPTITQAIELSTTINIPKVTINNITNPVAGAVIVPPATVVAPALPPVITPAVVVPVTPPTPIVAPAEPPAFTINTLRLVESGTYNTPIVVFNPNPSYGTITISNLVISPITQGWVAKSGWVNAPTWASVVVSGSALNLIATVPVDFATFIGQPDSAENGFGFRASWTCTWTDGPTISGARTVNMVADAVTVSVRNVASFGNGVLREKPGDTSAIVTTGNTSSVKLYDATGKEIVKNTNAVVSTPATQATNRTLTTAERLAAARKLKSISSSSTNRWI